MIRSWLVCNRILEVPFSSAVPPDRNGVAAGNDGNVWCFFNEKNWCFPLGFADVLWSCHRFWSCRNWGSMATEAHWITFSCLFLIRLWCFQCGHLFKTFGMKTSQQDAVVSFCFEQQTSNMFMQWTFSSISLFFGSGSATADFGLTGHPWKLPFQAENADEVAVEAIHVEVLSKFYGIALPKKSVRMRPIRFDRHVFNIIWL